jgi:hypothetical protein
MTKTTPEANLIDHAREGGPTIEQGGPAGEVNQAAGTVVARGQRGAVMAPMAATDPVTSMMLMMERIAKNKEVDVAKMREVKELGMSLLEDQRRAAFDNALAEMQDDLPTITAKGRLEIRAKDAKGERNGKVIQSTPYAKWEDINDAIKPVLKKHGFVLRFETGLTEDGRVRVTGILAGHGHREKSEFVLQHDATGSKNAVQAVGSSTSYGKRYAAGALLNLTSRGEDDDGKKGGGRPLEDGFPGDAPTYITSAQITQLADECKRVGCPRDKFLEWAQVATFEEILASDFDDRLHGLSTYRKAR